MASRATRGVTVIGNLNNVKRGQIPGLGAGGQRVIVRAMNTVGAESVELMQRVIDTTPSALVPGKDNRNWTGKMRASVGYVITNKEKGYYRLRLGWVDNVEDYFAWQDTGAPQDTRQWPIRGMLMLFQGYVYARDRMKASIEQAKSARK